MNPPSALHGAMSRERKPFTYTPGGLDLSEIKSERMAKRLMRNAMNQGVPEQPPQAVQSPPTPSTPIAVPNYNCLPVQVFPAFNLPANPKSLLRTRSTPDPSREPSVQRVPAQPPQPGTVNSFKLNGMEHLRETVNNNMLPQVNNNNYSNSRPTSLYDYSTIPNNSHTLVRTNYGSDALTTPILPEISYDAEICHVSQLNTKNVKPDDSVYSVNERMSPIKESLETVTPNFTIKPLSETVYVPAPVIIPIDDNAGNDIDEQKEVKVVKKQVKKEKKVESQNGDQNGEASTEAEMTVKLPAKKSAAKTETKVEVVKKVLPDGSVEEVKTTTTRTTIDGRTEIKTKTETTIIPKEEEEEVEEEEEEEETGEVVVQEAEENGEEEVVEESPKVIIKKTVQETPIKETSKIIKREEKSETTTTKKVTIQKSSKQEAEEEEEEEEEVEAEPVAVRKPPAVKPQPPPKVEPKEDEEEEEEEAIEEKKEEEEQVEELEEKEVEKVEVKKQVAEAEEEEEEEDEEVEEVEVKKEVKTEVKNVESEKPEEEEVEEEEEFEEAQETEEKRETKVEKPTVPTKKIEVQKEDDESEYTEEEIEPEKEEPPKPTPVEEVRATPKEEPKQEEQKEPQPEPAAPPSEPKVPLREPSIPLDKVEEVEIKPIGLVSKSHTESTEIKTTSEKPAGTLSTQTEYNRIENFVTVNRTTKTLDHSYEQLTQQGIPTVKTYFAPERERVSTSPQPSRPYQPVYPPQQQQERRHSLLLERLSTERQMPSDIYQNQLNNQSYEQQRQWSQEPQSEVINVSNVKPSMITNQQWYQQTRKDNVLYNNVLPTTPSQQWSQPQPQHQPQPQSQPQPQPQLQPQSQQQYQTTYSENTTHDSSRTTSNTYHQQNSFPAYTPKPSNWASSTLPSVNEQPNQYSFLGNDSTDTYQKTGQQQYSSSYVPPPWEQDPSYVAPDINTQNYYQPPPPANTFSPSTTPGWKPTPPPGRFSKPTPTAYLPPAPNQSFVKTATVADLPKLPGRKTYYSEYERRYITVPESTYIPGETKFQPQPDPSPQYYYDNNEPNETVEHEWRKELREFTEKTSQTQTQTEHTSIKPPWEEDPKYVKVPTVTYTPTPSWSQTLRPQSWRERSFESEYVGSKTNTLGRGRPLSSYGTVEATIPERPRGVSVDRYNPNNYQSPITTEHAPVQTHTLNPPTAPQAKAYHNPNVPAYHARASAEPREQPSAIPIARNWGDSRTTPLQSRSFKYLQWITGTED